MSQWSAQAQRLNAAVLNVFGDAVALRPPGSPVLTVEAQFDEAHELVEMQGEVPVSTTGPTLLVRLSDFVTPPQQGWDVDIGTGAAMKTYHVTDVQVDGDGMALLILVQA